MKDQLTTLPAVGRIHGMAVQRATTAALSSVTVQYFGHKNDLYELKMPFLDALYLLNLLQAASEESGFDHLRRPPER